MASTFNELYSDFIDYTQSYTERLTVTPLQFMRGATRGMQIFQRETELVSAMTKLIYDGSGFRLPDDVLVVQALFDAKTNTEILLNSFRQQANSHEWRNGRIDESRRDFEQYKDRDRYGAVGHAPIASVVNRRVIIDGAVSGEVLLYFTPDIQAFTQPKNNPPLPSDHWAAWFPIEDNFQDMFETATCHADLAPYEQAFVYHATSEYLKSRGSANYGVYEGNYYEHIKAAKMNKPYMNKFSQSVYRFAPYS